MVVVVFAVVFCVDNRVEFIAHQVVTSSDAMKRKQMMDEYYNKVSAVCVCVPSIGSHITRFAVVHLTV